MPIACVCCVVVFFPCSFAERVFAVNDQSIRVSFFDELLLVSEIAPRIRSEIETILSRTSADSPEYAKLQNLQFLLSGKFGELVRGVLSTCESFWGSYSMTNPAGYSQRDIDRTNAAEVKYCEALDKFNDFVKDLGF